MDFESWWMQQPISDFDGVTAAHVEAAWRAGVAAERERWIAALRCNGTCPPCRDPQNCKRKAVGLNAYLIGG